MTTAGSLPPRRVDQYTAAGGAGMLPAPSLLTYARAVIVFGPTGAVVGVFIYQPGTTPALGNPPVISLLGYPGSPATDPFGNPVDGGVVTYGTGGFAGGFAQLIQNQLALGFTNGASWLIAPAIIGGIEYWGVGPTGAPVYIGTQNNVATVVATQPGTIGTPEAWHALTVTAANYSTPFPGGFGIARYRFEAIGSQGVVRLGGSVDLLLNNAAGTVIATLPAAYAPAVDMDFTPANNLSGGDNGALRVNANGQIVQNQNGTAGNFLMLDGVTFPVD